MIHKTINNVIWDMDGTLYPANPEYKKECHAAAAKAAIEMGAEIDFDAAYDMAKKSQKKHGVWYPDFVSTFKFDQADFHNNHMNNIDIEIITPCPETIAGIMQASHLKHAIFTHATKTLAKKIVKERLGLENVFEDRIYGLEEVNFNLKSHSKEGYNIIIDSNGWNSSVTAMVDDSPSNLKKAKEAGLITVLIKNGKDISCEDADYEFSSTADFLNSPLCVAPTSLRLAGKQYQSNSLRP